MPMKTFWNAEKAFKNDVENVLKCKWQLFEKVMRSF